MTNSLSQPFTDPLFVNDSRVTYQAGEFREQLGLFAPGVRDLSYTTATPPAGGSFGVNQHAAGANMTVDINAGLALVQGGPDYDATRPWLGMYLVESVGITTVSTTSGDSSQARVDLVTLKIVDSGLSSGALNEAQIILVRGTAGAGTPALPASSLLLATINVAANATSITNTNIVDNRVTFGIAAQATAASLLDYQTNPVAVTSPSQVNGALSVPLVSSTVTVPANGKLLFRASVMFFCNATFGNYTPANFTASLQMADGASLLGAAEFMMSGTNLLSNANDDGASCAYSYLATGLTPGSTHTFNLLGWMTGPPEQFGTGMTAQNSSLEVWRV